MPRPTHSSFEGVGSLARPSAVLAVAVLLWPSPAAAFSRPKKEPDAVAQSCPEVGEGYVRLRGTGTCIRLGGLVRAEAVGIKGGR